MEPLNIAGNFLDSFESCVKEQPDAVAVVHDGKKMSYQTLNEEANKLANTLVEKGIKPDSVVSICLNRSTDFLISILGVFKASGCYLPLRPEDPPGRIAQMLRTSNTEYILSSAEHQKTLTEAHNITSLDCETLLLDHILQSDASVKNPGLPNQPGSLAYIIFTSGSTGTPKGAMVEHKGMLNHLHQKIKLLDINDETRLIQNASQCFDISVWQFLSSLLVGGQVHIITGSDGIEPSRLFNYVENNSISILEIVPSQLKSTLDWISLESDKPALNQLEWLVLTGEALSATLCNNWLKLYPNIPMQNAYGPTECSDDVTHHIIRAANKNISRIPIGSALDNIDLYVTKEDDPTQKVEQGRIGELCVAGIAVGRGYINDEKRTSAVFLQDPFSNINQRMYRTGDLVKENEPGVFEFIERLDRQVKLRGHRIELGEIEEALLRNDDVSDCTVVATRIERTSVYYLDNEENQQPVGKALPERQLLVAYIVASKTIKELNLIQYLADLLPSYMVPEQFIEMESLPLTDNGKLDLKSLPSPRNERPKYAGDFVAAGTSLESKLCGIWEDVLGLNNVGIKDNFVNLGGDSLLLVQVSNRIKKELKVSINFDELLVAKDISELCQIIFERETKSEISLTSIATAANDGALSPLTFGQKGLWFLWQLAPEVPYYTFQGLLQFRGSLNTDAMQAAFVKLVERHTILRTRFVQNDNAEPQQLLCPLNDFVYEEEDFTSWPVKERAQAVRRRAKELSARAFDLAVEIPFKVLQCKLDDQHYAIILTMHEIIMDAWSTTVLIQDIGRLYEYATINKLDEIRMPTVQYYDYAVWEEQFSHPDDLVREETYWKEQLDGAPPLLELPTDRPRPAYPSYRGHSVGVVLDLEFSEKIREIGRSENSTLFMTILASYYCLLHFQTGQSDIVIGAPSANRDHGESEELLGYFLNMLPLRVQMHDGITFRELIGKARDATSTGIANSRYPFANIVDLVSTADRDTRYSPVFQVMFDMLNFPKVPFKSDTLDVQFDELDVGYKKYDIELYTHEQNGHVYLRLSYLDDLFDRETVERMLDSLVAILKQSVSNPDTVIANIPMCSSKELDRLLHEFNDTALPISDEAIHQLFEQQAAKTPHSIALRCEDNTITYSELNNSANVLAHQLSEIVPHQTSVAVLVDRSIQEIVTLLAILKAGCAYVALDPEQPDDRLFKNVSTSKCQLCIIDETTSSRVTKLDIDRLLNVTKFLHVHRGIKKENLAWKGNSSDIACILGTSSSTGQPKPTQIIHKSVINRLTWMWNELPWKDGDTTTSLRPTSLITHLWEIFGGLCKGVETQLLVRDEVIDSNVLYMKLSTNKVAGFWCSPSILSIFLIAVKEHGGIWPELRYVATGGEAPPLKLVREFQQQLPHTRLINTYGTTEYSSTIATYDMALLPNNSERIPAGYPISNTQTYVLDDNMRVVPIGVHGEIYVGGAGVSPGYMDLPEMNAETFVPNPFTNCQEDRLYRTGDRGRIHSDGSLEIIGRSNHMVKVRGFRVELEEVSNALTSFDSVNRSACKAVEEDNTNSIVAYYSSITPIDQHDLRSYLTSLLPSYMIPKYFMWVENMPTTVSGKVAFTELPEPELNVETERKIIAPRNDTEKGLHQMWEKLLNVKPLSINDNFFEVGGHSLIAAQMITSINKEFGLQFSLQDLYRGVSTVEQIAATIDNEGSLVDSSANTEPNHEDNLLVEE